MDGRISGLEFEKEFEKAEFRIIDLETTGLSPKKDEILSIAIVPMTGWRIHIGDSFYSLIKPEKFNHRSIEYHGICPGDVNNAPSFEKIGRKIHEMLNGKIIVGYATAFDIEFLKRFFRKKLKIKLSLERHADISEIEAWIIRKKGIAISYRLDFDAILKTYGIEPSSRHNALSDAYFTARIFQKQLKKLLEYRATISDLIKIGRRLFIF